MENIILEGPGIKLEFDYDRQKKQMQLKQMKANGSKLLTDWYNRENNIGNPLTAVVYSGEYKGIYNMKSFKVKKVKKSEKSLTVLLENKKLPLQILMLINVEGHVATWRGQACWQGEEDLEAGIFFPLFSKINFHRTENRAILPQISGRVLSNIDEVNYCSTYVGNLSSPSFLVEGQERGLAFLDDNKADYAPHPGNSVRRSYVIGNDISKYKNLIDFQIDDRSGGEEGPFVGICNSRIFKKRTNFEKSTVKLFKQFEGQTAEGGEIDFQKNMWSGDYVDLGPVNVYAYKGSWKIGASWLRNQRKDINFRESPAKWYRNTTMIAEDMGDDMVQRGQSFYDYPQIMGEKEKLGSNLFHLPGYHDGVRLDSKQNWLNRGDYFFAAQNLGGFEAARKGIEAIHRRGGHVLYYIEILIMWKLSRIGKEKGQNWALMKKDGSYTEHYQDFWHMCPACEEWRDWVAETCAEITRELNVDGFFLDSAVATHNHRCYNPEHDHSHPDIWNWGMRRLFKSIRKAVDEVTEDTVLLAEGCADLAREYVDGFISHSHDWCNDEFDIPFIRFLHSDMRAFESWARKDIVDESIEHLHVWNFVNGQRIYCHGPHHKEMEDLSYRARRYYDSYPEICDADMPIKSINTHNCIAEIFGLKDFVITVGNITDENVEAKLEIPVPAGLLFDRVDSLKVPVKNQKALLNLKPWEFRAFEIRV